MAKAVISKESGWRCQACGKPLTAKPVLGKVIAHSARNGGLCPGSGKAASNSSIKRKSKKPQARRNAVGDGTTASKSRLRLQAQKLVAEKRERPEVLPTKKATGGLPAPNGRVSSEAHWSFFQDNPRQDLETDAGWRRVRLGTSQGTGRRR